MKAKKIFSLLLLTAAVTACSNEENNILNKESDGRPLQVSVGMNTQSRTVVTGNTLDDGSIIGLALSGDRYEEYTNVAYTAAGTGSTQKWNTEEDIIVYDEPATVYAYYPYTGSADVAALQFSAGETDYLYATPVTDVDWNSPEVPLQMNHALAHVKVNVVSEDYIGEGDIEQVTIQSDGIAAAGTFNAAQETPAYTAYTGTGEPVTGFVEAAMDGQAAEYLIVPTATEAPVTFMATIDGKNYTVTSAAVKFQMGMVYEYTLKIKSDILMEVSTVGVTTWTAGQAKEELELASIDIDLTTAENGVYAVTADGKGRTLQFADESCVAVALIVNDAPTPQRLMIAKADATELYWGHNLQGKDVSGITNIDSGTGYLPKADGTYQTTPNLSGDYTTWTSGGLSDFNGKANTTAIINAYTEHAVEMNTRDMCSVLNTFNSSDAYNDWYVPACGQLALIYLNLTEINEALTAIGGTAYSTSYYYWSSSEYSSLYGWYVDFYYGYLYYDIKFNYYWVRFVRDF